MQPGRRRCGALHLPATGGRRRALPVGLRGRRRRGRALRHHGRGRHPQSRRGVQEERRLPQEPPPPGARARDGGRVCRVAARQAAQPVGFPRPAGDDDDGSLQGELPREAIFVRLSGVPPAGGSADPLPRPPARGDRRRADRRLHDGSGGERLRRRLPPPRRDVLQRRGWGGSVGPAVLPALATSGIGSLPHTQLELALQQALLLDIPAAPQLPRRDAAEYMVPQALEGLHGLRADAEGNASLDLGDWRRGAATLDARLDHALERDDGMQRFLPSTGAWQALRPFLWEVEQRKLPFAKVQIAGPFTLRWVLRTTQGEPLAATGDGKAIERQIFRLVLARALALSRRLRETGARPLIFLDEPGLYAFDRRDPQHLVSLQELRVVVLALRRDGAVVGVHCCGNTEWAPLLGLGWDVVSIDARLSLEAVLATGPAFERFQAAGGVLSLGIVPTDLSAPDDVDAVLQDARARLGREVLARSLLTPACGLAMRSVPDAERIFAELRRAQQQLRGGDSRP